MIAALPSRWQSGKAAFQIFMTDEISIKKKTTLRLPEDIHWLFKATAANRHMSEQEAFTEAARLWLAQDKISIEELLNSVNAEISDDQLRERIQSILSSGDSKLMSLVHVVIQAAAELCAQSPHVSASADSSLASSEAGSVSEGLESAEALAREAKGAAATRNRSRGTSDGGSKKRRGSGGGSTAS